VQEGSASILKSKVIKPPLAQDQILAWGICCGGTNNKKRATKNEKKNIRRARARS